MSELKKELKALLDTFDRKVANWEWSDMVKWLRTVHSLLVNVSNVAVPCKYTLAKRLTQCLNPNLPQGPHYVTLNILQRIFELCAQHHEHYKENLALFSAGLFPFFQYASPENKELVLVLVKDYFLPLGPQISFALPGLVCAFCPSLIEVGNAALETKIKQYYTDSSQDEDVGVKGFVSDLSQETFLQLSLEI